MIDNSRQVAVLMLKLKTHLPIPAKPTDILIRQLGAKSINISPDSQIEVTDVMYMGDEGGICCALKVINQEEVAFVVSLTHLRFLKTNPFLRDIRSYQTLRIKKLAKRH
jgi:hypothetical protein